MSFLNNLDHDLINEQVNWIRIFVMRLMTDYCSLNFDDAEAANNLVY